MIEAVIVLPVLILTFAGVQFMRERYLGRQRTMLAVRACTWTHAIEGCGEAPPECTAGLQRAPVDDGDAATILEAAREHPSSGTVERAFDVFDDVPVLGDAIRALFGTQTAGYGETLTALPWNRDALAVDPIELALLCNERPHDVLAAAQDVFCHNVPLVPCR